MGKGVTKIEGWGRGVEREREKERGRKKIEDRGLICRNAVGGLGGKGVGGLFVSQQDSDPFHAEYRFETQLDDRGHTDDDGCGSLVMNSFFFRRWCDAGV